jgi:hypothetical protein
MLRDSPTHLIRWPALAAACVFLPGCYYLHLAAGQLEMNRRREPIAEVIARDGSTMRRGPATSR